MTLNIMTVDDRTVNELIASTYLHCASVITNNAQFRSDDGMDYLSSAAEIAFNLSNIDRDGEGEYYAVRRWFDRMFTAGADDEFHPYNAYASDAVPPVWDAYIVNNLFD